MCDDDDVDKVNNLRLVGQGAEDLRLSLSRLKQSLFVSALDCW